MALWSPNSPDSASARQQADAFFAAQNKVVVSNFSMQKLKVNRGRANLRVRLEMSAIDAKTGKPAAGLGRMSRNVECVKEAGGWRVWREFSR